MRPSSLRRVVPFLGLRALESQREASHPSPQNALSYTRLCFILCASLDMETSVGPDPSPGRAAAWREAGARLRVPAWLALSCPAPGGARWVPATPAGLTPQWPDWEGLGGDNPAQGHLLIYTEKELPGIHTCESARARRLFPGGKLGGPSRRSCWKAVYSEEES